MALTVFLRSAEVSLCVSFIFCAVVSASAHDTFRITLENHLASQKLIVINAISLHIWFGTDWCMIGSHQWLARVGTKRTLILC